MVRTVGTTTKGIRAPIVKEGDNIVDIVVDSVLQSASADNYQLHDQDVVGITESLVARAQGNYVTIEQIQKSVNKIFNNDSFGVVFPILSRNRFSIIMKSLALTGKKIDRKSVV